MKKVIYMLGYGSDVAGANRGSGDGAACLSKSPYLAELQKNGLDIEWQAMLKPEAHFASTLNAVENLSQKLATEVKNLVSEKKFFTVIGGDHASAIGTWSGASAAIQSQGALGLIWIDAHMDSHTPETSPSGNIHGMPLACLLGRGEKALTNLFSYFPKIKPEHICLIGVRSFEEGEDELLTNLNVKIFFMEEVERRGLDAVMKDAIKIATTGTAGFGITIDIDSMDPADAPGTGVAEENGLSAKELCSALKQVAQHSNLLGVEIVEFDPHRDIEQKTEKLIPELISAMTLGRPLL